MKNLEPLWKEHFASSVSFTKKKCCLVTDNYKKYSRNHEYTLNGKSVVANVMKDFEIALPSLSVLIRGVRGDLTQTDETPSC